jgi:ABC-type phosphate transport system substrate-binding protein
MKKQFSLASLPILLALAGGPMAGAGVGLVAGSALAQTTPAPGSEAATLRIDGSDSMTAVNQELKAGFEATTPGAAVTLGSSGTAVALQALLAGQLDLAAIGRPLTVAEKAQSLVEIPIKREKIAMVASDSNPFQGSLTITQFAQIVHGEITDWSQVGGAAGPVRVVDQPDASDTRQAFNTYPAFSSNPFQPPASATKLPDEAVASVVDKLGNDGIGYVTADQVKSLPGVRAVTMHQTQPDDPRYPFSHLQAYVYKQGALSPAAQAFLGYLVEPAGQLALKAASSSGAELLPVAAAVAAAQSNAASPAAPSPAAPSPIGSPVATAASPAAAPVAAAPNPPPAPGPGDLSWLWWLLPLGVAGLAWWALKGRGSAVDEPSGSIDLGTAAPDVPLPVTPPATDLSPNLRSDVPPDMSLPVTPPATNLNPDLSPAVSLPVTPPATNLSPDLSPDLNPVTLPPRVAPEPQIPPTSASGSTLAAAGGAALAAGAAAGLVGAGQSAPSAESAESAPSAAGTLITAIDHEPITQLPAAHPPASPTIAAASAGPDAAPRDAGIADPWDVPAAATVSGTAAALWATRSVAPAAETAAETPLEPAAESAVEPNPRSATPDRPPSAPIGLAAAGLVGAAGAAAAAALNQDPLQTTIEAARFNASANSGADLAPADLVNVDEGLADLPDGYDESRVMLLARDPQWAYAYWDIPLAARAARRSQGGQQLALRICDVTDLADLDQRPHSVQQYALDEAARNWYLPIPVSDRDYIAELGYTTIDGTWLLLARSNAIRIPPVYPSDWQEEQYISVDWQEPLAGKTFLTLMPPRPLIEEEEEVAADLDFHEEMYLLSLGGLSDRRVDGSVVSPMRPPDALAELSISSFMFPAGLGAWGMSGSGIGLSGGMSGIGMSGIGMSGIGMSASMPPIRPRQFWLVADAELIVYGATEPDATVTIGDRQIPLNADGTFRFQLSFQDGQLAYPIMAVAVDGEQTREVELRFERQTPQRRTNTKAEAQDEWF